MIDVLEKCLISNKNGKIDRFLDFDFKDCPSELENIEQNGRFEEGTVAKVNKLKDNTYRVHFILKSGFIQVVKDVPSRLPFLIPGKGWAVCTPTKVHTRIHHLKIRDKVYFKVDSETKLPKKDLRKSFNHRVSSSMFDDSDFVMNNVVYPNLPKKSIREKREQLMSHIVSSTEPKPQDTPQRDDQGAMTSKMKRSIPGDFRSSVEAGRTGKHSIKPDKDNFGTSLDDTLDSNDNNDNPACTLAKNPVPERPKNTAFRRLSTIHGTPTSLDSQQTPTSLPNHLQTPTSLSNHLQTPMVIANKISTNHHQPPTTLQNKTPVLPDHHQTTSSLPNQHQTPTPDECNAFETPKKLENTQGEGLLWYLTKSAHTPVHRRLISKEPPSTVKITRTAEIPVSTELPILEPSGEVPGSGADDGASVVTQLSDVDTALSKSIEDVISLSLEDTAAEDYRLTDI